MRNPILNLLRTTLRDVKHTRPNYIVQTCQSAERVCNMPQFSSSQPTLVSIIIIIIIFCSRMPVEPTRIASLSEKDDDDEKKTK